MGEPDVENGAPPDAGRPWQLRLPGLLRPAANVPRRQRDGKTRVLILMSDTGGGHRASAEALKAGFEELYGSRHQVEVLDMWAHHTPYPWNQANKVYPFLVKHPLLWRAGFQMSQSRLVHVPGCRAFAAAVGQRLSEAFDLHQPDLVVSVHPFMQQVPLRIMRMRIKAGMQPPTPFATVVTDLTTCHNIWFNPQVDRCYVATEPTLQQAIRLGMQRVRLYGLPIRPAFARALPEQSELRRELGMVQGKPAVLLMGGGEGMGPVEATLDGLVQHIGAGCQVVVVCGRNARLVERLQVKRYPQGMHVVVKGFVTNMHEIMGASDVIVTKAGPGTIMEALICGLPLVLNAFIPCQEEGNIPFVVENKVGVFEEAPERIARTIQAWLSPEASDEFAAMKTRARALGKPHALFDICRDLASLVEQNAQGPVQGAQGATGQPLSAPAAA